MFVGDVIDVCGRCDWCVWAARLCSLTQLLCSAACAAVGCAGHRSDTVTHNSLTLRVASSGLPRCRAVEMSCGGQVWACAAPAPDSAISSASERPSCPALIPLRSACLRLFPGWHRSSSHTAPSSLPRSASAPHTTRVITRHPPQPVILTPSLPSSLALPSSPFSLPPPCPSLLPPPASLHQRHVGLSARRAAAPPRLFHRRPVHLVPCDWTRGVTCVLPNTTGGSATVASYDTTTTRSFRFGVKWDHNHTDSYSITYSSSAKLYPENNLTFCSPLASNYITFNTTITPRQCNYTVNWTSTFTGTLNVTYTAGTPGVGAMPGAVVVSTSSTTSTSFTVTVPVVVGDPQFFVSTRPVAPGARHRRRRVQPHQLTTAAGQRALRVP